jgi:tetratricopeptide (TPR) repeat protein
MEEIQGTENNAGGCINCGHPVVVKGYPNALCESCRNSYIKFPIPKGVKLFAIGIGLIFLFSIYKIPKDIGLGIHLDKGNTALEDKRYLTAEKELQKVVDKVPDDLEVQSNLFIASFYNEDFATFSKMFAQLNGRKYEDMELYNRVDAVMKESEMYYPNDSFVALQQRYNNNVSQIPDAVLKTYIAGNKDQTYPLLALASRLFDSKSYVAADSVLTAILSTEPEHIPALNMMAALKREENQPAASIAYCDKLLAINKESVYAFSAKSRTLLKQKKDAEAMALALKCHGMDETNYHATGSLALAYHFNNKVKEQNDLLNKMALAKDSASVLMLQYVKDVISGKENFRN